MLEDLTDGGLLRLTSTGEQSKDMQLGLLYSLAVGGDSILHPSLLELLSNSELVNGGSNGNHGGRKTYRLRRRDFESILKS